MSKTIAVGGHLTRIASRGLVDQSVEALRRSILAGKFGHDGVLPSQGELSDRLGVSRPVIREAMRILQSQGLLHISQGRKPQVRPASPQAVIESIGTLLERADVTLLDLVEARRPLESEIAALAAVRAEPADLTNLRSAIEEQRTARSMEARVEADVKFHRALARATGNPIFELVLEALAQHLRESRRRTIQESGVEVPIAHHARILKAVERRDDIEARKAMLFHLDMAKGDIERSEKKRGTRRN